MANYSRPAPTGKALSVDDAKERVLNLIQDGFKVAEAMAAVDRKEETYRDWRKNDKEFAASVDSIRTARKEEKETGKPQVPDFPEFCAEWLKQPLYPHQLRILDAIEGREPRDIHESMTYRPGDPQRVVINVPPEHAKSTTFTVNYIVWLIHKNPDIRVVIMCASIELAKHFLYEIKQKLTSPVYREMHLRFGPEGGWKDKHNPWSSTLIYVQGKNRHGVQKDPTVQAMGLKGTIYGQRCDVIILDDIVITKNANEVDLQMRLINRDIQSRLPSKKFGGGLLAILGTRVTPGDLYRNLIDVENHDGNPIWTYFRQPAVLDYGDGSSDTWETLWPEMWDGPSLAGRKMDSGSWNLIYQQLNVDDDMTFKAEAVDASINQGRFPGVMRPGARNHRDRGMEGLYVVGGLDPGGSAGNTAIIIAALDRETQKRYILDGFNKTGCSPAELRAQVKHYTEMYGIHEWVIERNGLQTLLTRDPDLTQYLRAHGAKLWEHHTNNNKYDSDFGIGTMAPLFESCGEPDPKSVSGRWTRTPDKALIELPATRQNKWVNDLVQQLVIWKPAEMAQKAKSDLVMALWFCEIAFKKIIKKTEKRKTHYDSPFLSAAGKRRQGVVSLADIRREKYEQQMLGGVINAG